MSRRNEQEVANEAAKVQHKFSLETKSAREELRKCLDRANEISTSLNQYESKWYELRDLKRRLEDMSDLDPVKAVLKKDLKTLEEEMQVLHDVLHSDVKAEAEEASEE